MDINSRVFVFARDQATVAEVKEYFEALIDKQILNLVYAKEDITGYAEAKNIINSCFSSMQREVSGYLEKPFVNENI